METNNDGSVGFNKRRAEGLDKNDKPKKTLHLKTRELNPTNTICYVQVYILGFWLNGFSFMVVTCV